MSTEPQRLEQVRLNRRRLLLASGGALAASAVVGVTRPLWSAGGEGNPTVKELASQVQGYRRYYVVPASLEKFSDERRKELDVLGPQQAALSCRNKQCHAPGFMAWLDPIAAGQLALEKDVTTVYELTTADVPVIGSAENAGGSLSVFLAPNGWSVEPKEGTFLTADSLAKQWQEKLQDVAAATVTPNAPQRVRGAALRKGPGLAASHVVIDVQFVEPKVPPQAVRLIHEHSQVTQLHWGGAGQPFGPGGGFLDGCPGCGLG